MKGGGRTLLLASSLHGFASATKPSLCGPECGPLLAELPHNQSCWRYSTQSFFSFDVQPHYHIGDACFGENDPSAPFYFNGVYHVMWQSHTQYEHVPAWNKLPGGQRGDTGISFGHAVSHDLAHWTQVENALWPDRWFTSVSVYDGSTTVVDGVPTIVASGLTPNTTSGPFCHAKAVPANVSDPNLVDWIWDDEPMICGSKESGLMPFDAPTSAWQNKLGQWMYTDGRGNVFVSDDFKAWRQATGDKFPSGLVVDFYPLPRTCDGCDVQGLPDQPKPTHIHQLHGNYTLFRYIEGGRNEAGRMVPLLDWATVASAHALGCGTGSDYGRFGFPKSFFDPIKQRRIMYGWVQNSRFHGEEDDYIGNLSFKGNHQSLLREVTFDPRLGRLNFLPVEETKLLRVDVLAQIAKPTAVPASGVLPLPTPPNVANQSEVRVSFAVPTEPVTFGVRVLKSEELKHPSKLQMDFAIVYTPPPAGVDAWAVDIIAGFGGPIQKFPMPMLRTDKEIEILVYVDHTTVEAFFAGGRYVLTTAVPETLMHLPPSQINHKQSVEIFANTTGAVVSSATVWRMDSIWLDVKTHDRPSTDYKRPDVQSLLGILV